MTDDRFNATRETMTAVGMSLGLLLTALIVTYAALGSAQSAAIQHRLHALPIDTALFLYLISETDVPQKIRKSRKVRAQLGIWTAWLAVLGLSPVIARLLPEWWVVALASLGAAAFSLLRLFLTDRLSGP